MPNDAVVDHVERFFFPLSSYTAILRGKTNGVGQVEVYDLETTSATHLVNISTRASVGPDDNTILIGGFIIDGQVSHQVLIRALGPSLSGAGVSRRSGRSDDRLLPRLTVDPLE